MLAFLKSVIDCLHDLGHYLFYSSGSSQLLMDFLFPEMRHLLGMFCIVSWGPSRTEVQLSTMVTCIGIFPFLVLCVHSLVVPPGIISQINYLHSITYLRICCQENPK